MLIKTPTLYQAVFRNPDCCHFRKLVYILPLEIINYFLLMQGTMSLHFEYYKNRLIELHERRIRHGGVERYYLLLMILVPGLISEWFYNWLSRVRQRTIVATALIFDLIIL